MISESTVVLSVLQLVFLTLPVGYLAVGFFQDRLRSITIAHVPLYMGTGLCIQILISFLIGITQLLPSMLYAISLSSLIILFFRYISAKKSRGSIFKLVASKRVEILSLILIVVVSGYFIRIPIETQWPPIGDAILHSTLTSLILEKGKMATEMMPLLDLNSSMLLPYPQGFHLFSANLSLMLDIGPAEAVFVLATFLIILVALLLYSFTYTITKSVLLSLPVPFFILIAHSTGDLEMWLGGYIWNGPYVQLFAFVAVLLVITLCQIMYELKRSILLMSTIFVIIFICLIVTYPQFVFHSIICVLVYLLIQRFLPTKYAYNSSFLLHEVSIFLPKRAPDRGQDTFAVDAENPKSRLGLTIVLSSSITVGIFIILFIYGDLVSFYYRLFEVNVEIFKEFQESTYLSLSNIFPKFVSDPFFAIFFYSAVWGSVAFMALTARVVPFFVYIYLILLTVLSGLSYIYPLRTVAFLAAVSLPMIAFMISVGLIWLREHKNLRVLPYALYIVFILVIFYIEAPFLIIQATSEPGWFVTKTEGFNDTYNVANWIDKNVETHERILNDKTYSSLYTQSISLSNLTYNYLNGQLVPVPHLLTMFTDLDTIWTNPDNEENIKEQLRKYDVKFILLTPEYGYPDYVYWGGSGEGYLPKPFNQEYYMSLFNQYPFLTKEYYSGGAVIYSVNSV